VDPTLAQQFQLEYSKLNQQQREAVDTIEGPVMVIAGAGTGKTQTIALRIANIIRQNQTPPSSILCLTFTDSAAVNMRRRLLSIIGPTAYSVKICTFHSFCNEVIQENPDYFIFAKNIKNLEDLEKLEIIQQLIESLNDQSPLKPWGDHFYYQSEIISNIQSLKRENINPADLLALIGQVQSFLTEASQIYDQLKALRAGKQLAAQVEEIFKSIISTPNLSESLFTLFSYHGSLYRGGAYDQGPAKSPAVNFKNALIKIFENLKKDLPKQQELCDVYRQYQQTLKDKGFYDYDDMVLFVINAFRQNSDLLLSYQERFQYLLVDEYQDTNASQNQILTFLSSYFDRPNLFVVGDDDQAIFRFQGASIENVYEFVKKYDPQIVVLKNNYRSHQLILDSSTSVINHNLNRISNYLKNIDKSLVAASTFDADPINLFAARSQLEENAYVSRTIKKLLNGGVSPSQIAVLYRNNSDVVDLCEALTHEGIRYYLPSKEDVLKNKLFIQLISLLTYVQDPARSDQIYHLLSSPFISLYSLDLLKLLRYSYRHHLSLEEIILDSKNLHHLHLTPGSRIKLHNFILRVAKARKWLETYNLDKFFNKVIRKFKFLNYCLSLNDPQTLNQLNTFYSYLKQLCLQNDYQLSDFLNRLNRLSQNRLPLPAPPLPGDESESIQLLTVHRAKGMEFEHVFLFKVVDKKWGNVPNYSSLRLPPGIVKTDISRQLVDQNEDERRLFYVALTRAKSQIYISYSQANDNGRSQLPSVFISEIDPKLIQDISPSPSLPSTALQTIFNASYFVPQTTESVNRYLQNLVSNHYKFNVTHLNSYLRCPFCFYHKTILRIPAAKNKFSSFGTAIHAALSYLFETLRSTKRLPTLEDLLAFYQRSLLGQNLTPKDYQESLVYGQETLTGYYQHYYHQFFPEVITEYDFTSDNVYLDNIPLTGKIDKIEIVSPNIARVVDFKTGNPDTKSKELSEDGDYFRQLVFYKLLASHSHRFKYQVSQGVVDFVQPSKTKNRYVQKEFDLTDAHLDQLSKLIREVYQKILNLDFYQLGRDCRDELGVHYLLSSKS
jgi:DNA helicase-2/ATP-dependent DNA helicase PcrA